MVKKSPVVESKLSDKGIEKNQPEVNIGLVGHVDNGKTTLVKALTGKWTDTHSEEIKRGITIKLGYADAIFSHCNACKTYATEKLCIKCKKATTPLRKVSFIDAPGHESLMATMLSGATIMDGAILLVAANEECPQPQTKEHLMALEIMGLKQIVIAQNKIDLVSEEQAVKNYNQIKAFVKGTIAEKAPIIPLSAQHLVNIGPLIEAIQATIKTPERDRTKEPIMFIARSFDVNRPGTEVEQLVGGILGGSLKQGSFKVDDEIEIKPGLVKTKEGRYSTEPITTKIISLKTGGLTVQEVWPGGSIGVLTSLDPSYVRADTLAGNIVGLKGKLPPVWAEFKIKPVLLERVVGSKDEVKVESIKKMETLMLNVNAAATVGVVRDIRKEYLDVVLKLPVCCSEKDRITISRMLGNRWRLIGYGTIVK